MPFPGPPWQTRNPMPAKPTPLRGALRGIGERVRRGRVLLGWSQERLGQAIGRDRATVRQWEAGEWEPQSAVIAPLADALGVEIRWLLTGEGPEIAPPAAGKGAGLVGQ